MKKTFGCIVLATALIVMIPTAFTEPQKPPSADVPAEITEAMQQLQGAKNDLEHAGGDWGGYRNKAIGNINQAMANLNEAEKWAKEHKAIK
jgi:hypothetical protein